eukprot:TRINITY_DN182_c0_g2_i1.p2 TRINITY_DN182_c0_g2~~TRINITY_DN182_c0_g2_i1.p2  ORF type:complete len:112 (+),score=33.44 TRINITY_DN182_c0_g2_i1:471-806(+)
MYSKELVLEVNYQKSEFSSLFNFQVSIFFTLFLFFPTLISINLPFEIIFLFQFLNIEKIYFFPVFITLQYFFNSQLINQFKQFPMYSALICLLYTSPSPRDKRQSRMPSSA